MTATTPEGVTAPTATEVAAYLRTTEAAVSAALAVAVAEVDRALEGAWRPIPQATYTQVVYDVTQDVLRRRDNLAAGGQYAALGEAGGQPTRAPRDPLATVRPILANYVTPF